VGEVKERRCSREAVQKKMEKKGGNMRKKLHGLKAALGGVN